MTIVAGFRVRDGVLLCSDTLYSGDAKSYREKIWYKNTELGSVAFAVAGYESFTLTAIQDCQRKIEEACSRKRRKSSVELRKILSESMRRFQIEHFAPLPAEDRTNAWLEILFAVKEKSGTRARLFHTSSLASFAEVERRKCIGVGDNPLMEYLVDHRYSATMDTWDGVTLAMQVVKAAKDYVDGCGGNVATLVLRDDGSFEQPTLRYNTEDVERWIAEYERATGNLLLCLGNPRLDGQTFDHRLKFLVRSIETLREAWSSHVTNFERFERAMRELSATTEEAPQDPQSTTADPSRPQPSPGLPGGSDES